MQPFQCDLQPQLQETHRTTHTWTSILAKHIGGTNRVRNDRSHNRRTDEVGCSHFTQKNTRFYYVLFHYVLFCDLPPFIKVNCIASILLLCIVTSCIVMWSTTLHHSQFHSFLFFSYVLLDYVLLHDLPPFIIVNFIVSYSFVVYCYAMYC